MAVKIVWKPVLQPLLLREYHPDYGDEKILVCVNPQPAFLKERSELMAENSRRLAEVGLLKQKAEIAGSENREQAEQKYNQAFAEYVAWGETVFLPAVQAWFAQLWSFGPEQYTAADLDQYQEIDPHFASWAKVRSMEMIEQHASARKKA